MTQLFANNVTTTVASSFSSVSTSLTVVDGSKMPSPTGGNFFLITLYAINSNGQEITWEIIKITARSGNVLTCVRAQEGTTAVLWAVASPVHMRATAATLTAKADTNSPTFITPIIGVANGTSLTLSGGVNLGAAGAGARISCDFSNTDHSLRTLLQTSTLNSNTIVGVAPNGTGVAAAYILYNSNNGLNCNYAQLLINSGSANLIIGKVGTMAVDIPFNLVTGGITTLTSGIDGSIDIPNLKLNVFKETTFLATNVSNTFTINLANGSIQKIVAVANSTIVLPPAVAGKSYVVLVEYTGAYSITWQAYAGGSNDLRWADGIAPIATMVNSKVDKYAFMCYGSTTTYGSDAGRNN